MKTEATSRSLIQRRYVTSKNVEIECDGLDMSHCGRRLEGHYDVVVVVVFFFFFFFSRARLMQKQSEQRVQYGNTVKL